MPYALSPEEINLLMLNIFQGAPTVVIFFLIGTYFYNLVQASMSDE